MDAIVECKSSWFRFAFLFFFGKGQRANGV